MDFFRLLNIADYIGVRVTMLKKKNQIIDFSSIVLNSQAIYAIVKQEKPKEEKI